MGAAVTEQNGILMYDLAGNWCEECGRAKSLRLFGYLTGCTACDDVVTAHRCTGRPELDELPLGASWACPDCGGTWTAAEEEDFCGECGQSTGMKKTWDVTEGDRIGTAPRHVPQPFTPFRNAIYQTARTLTDRPRYSALSGAYSRPGPFGDCYQMTGGSWVHVRPGCRCKT